MSISKSVWGDGKKKIKVRHQSTKCAKSEKRSYFLDARTHPLGQGFPSRLSFPSFALLAKGALRRSEGLFDFVRWFARRRLPHRVSCARNERMNEWNEECLALLAAATKKKNKLAAMFSIASRQKTKRQKILPLAMDTR